MGTRSTSKRRVQRIARQLADALLDGVVDEGGRGSVPLRQIITSRTDLTIREGVGGDEPGENLELFEDWPVKEQLPVGQFGALYKGQGEGDSDRILVNRFQTTGAMRFTLAHELCHYLLHERSELVRGLKGDRRELSPKLVERVCDEFAGYILAPDRLLASLQIEALPDRGVRWIEKWADELKVSVQVLTKRMSEYLAPGPEGWFVVTADYDVAQSKRKGLALRVRTCIAPKGLLIFNNKRLITMGLGEVVERYGESDPFEVIDVEGSIQLERVGIWKTIARPYRGEFKGYVTGDGYEYLVMVGGFV